MRVAEGAVLVGAVAVAGLLVWPILRVELLRRKSGVIEQGDYLHDPETGEYLKISTGRTVWKP